MRARLGSVRWWHIFVCGVLLAVRLLLATKARTAKAERLRDTSKDRHRTSMPDGRLKDSLPFSNVADFSFLAVNLSVKELARGILAGISDPSPKPNNLA
jgi:hypothetical protein